MKLLSSLTNRIFLASALLAVVPIGVAIYVVHVQVTRQAEAELLRGLEEAGTLVEEYRGILFAHFVREARLIADLPIIKAAVDTDDPPTVQLLAEDYLRRIGADLFVVTNRGGTVLAALGGAELAVGEPADLPALRDASAGREGVWYWPQAGGVLQVVSVPIWIDPADPEILGSLSVGFSLDERVAARFRTLTNSEIAFAFDGRVQASTLAGEAHDRLAGLLGGRGVSRLALGDHEYVAVARALPAVLPHESGGPPAAAGAAAAGDAPVAIVLRSRTERLRFLNRLHTVLGGTALVAVLAAILLSYGVARTITRPLDAITAAMRETATTGDLTRKIVLPGGRRWDDEDARLLAGAFNTMTDSVARFQQEARQRERLSSLGRLSTVVAHEIRNPLMIIKTSLRSLKREDAGPDRIRAAAEDIEGEVARLNRLVTEVLDFARPIQFDYAPADLNAICADAARAAAAGQARPAIRLQLDDRLPPVLTDGERLRLALVNVLENAYHAVTAGSAPAGSGAPDAAAIELTTQARPGDRVRIVVRDRGPGIAATDLPKIFDPYFTTRRTGTGLGLAIARNIVEGLGGTIVVESRAGGDEARGTELRMELPLRPADRRAPQAAGASPPR